MKVEVTNFCAAMDTLIDQDGNQLDVLPSSPKIQDITEEENYNTITSEGQCNRHRCDRQTCLQSLKMLCSSYYQNGPV